VKAGAKLRASSATTIRVVGRVLVSNGGEVGPTPGAFAVDPFTAVVGARHFVTFSSRLRRVREEELRRGHAKEDAALASGPRRGSAVALAGDYGSLRAPIVALPSAYGLNARLRLEEAPLRPPPTV
jgi:hypothetical protein